MEVNRVDVLEKGLCFGKTTVDGLKKLREVDIGVKTISSLYFHLLCFIKYIAMIILLPLIK